jgi:putative aldouronate transport system substrate-binding protein
MAANEWNGVPIYTGFFQDRMVLNTGNILASVYGVCAVSKHQTEAVKFIEEMNTNVDLLNLFNYGIEGKHWVWVDKENKIVGYPEGVDGNTVGWNPNTYWQFGDKRLLYLTTPDDIGVLDRDAADLAKAIVSPLMGFVPDLTPIQNELAQLATVAKQYCDPLDKGMIDVESGLKDCQDQIKSAGIDTITAELQKQIEAWKAAQ